MKTLTFATLALAGAFAAQAVAAPPADLTPDEARAIAIMRSLKSLQRA